MDYNHLKNCRKMLDRSGKTFLQTYQYLNEEIAYREWEKEYKKDDHPTSRFELLDFD